MRISFRWATIIRQTSPELPAFNSEQDRLNSQVDIYESEIYTRLRRAKMFSSQLDHFSNDQELQAAAAISSTIERHLHGLGSLSAASATRALGAGLLPLAPAVISSASSRR